MSVRPLRARGGRRASAWLSLLERPYRVGFCFDAFLGIFLDFSCNGRAVPPPQLLR